MTYRWSSLTWFGRLSELYPRIFGLMTLKGERVEDVARTGNCQSDVGYRRGIRLPMVGTLWLDADYI